MLTGTATHASLIARLGDRADSVAWAEFVSRYGDLIRGFARRRGVQPADVDDVLQEVLLAMSKAAGRFVYDPQRGRFRGYLKTIVVHAVLRRAFQKTPGTGLSESSAALEAGGAGAEAASGGPMDEEAWELEWRRYHLAMAMRVIETEFNEADRVAFQRYGVDGVDARTAAAETGLSVDGVYQAKSRILRRLAALIAAQVAEEG